MSLVGERKAIAAAVLALYTLLYVLNGLFGPPELKTLFAALGALYGLTFFSVVAGYFWARWFAIGLGLYGVIGGVLAAVQVGVDYDVLFYGGTHGLISLMMWGVKMSSDYDGRPDWRERFHLDEDSTRRLGKAVIRIGITLPILVIYGLAPRPDMVETLGMLALVGLVGVGVVGVLRLRTSGVILLGLGAVGVACSALATSATASMGNGVSVELPATGAMAALLLAACVAPFARPVARYLAGR